MLGKLLLDSALEFLMDMGIPEGSIQTVDMCISKMGGDMYSEFLKKNRTVIGSLAIPMNARVLQVMDKAEKNLKSMDDLHLQVCLKCARPKIQ